MPLYPHYQGLGWDLEVAFYVLVIAVQITATSQKTGTVENQQADTQGL